MLQKTSIIANVKLCRRYEEFSIYHEQSLQYLKPHAQLQNATIEGIFLENRTRILVAFEICLYRFWKWLRATKTEVMAAVAHLASKDGRQTL